jgi:hypothetical protein
VWRRQSKMLNEAINTTWQRRVSKEDFSSTCRYKQLETRQRIVVSFWLVAAIYPRARSQGHTAIEKFSIQNPRVKWHFCWVSQTGCSCIMRLCHPRMKKVQMPNSLPPMTDRKRSRQKSFMTSSTEGSWETHHMLATAHYS